MMKINKLIHIFFMSAIIFLMSACVPKATENKAVCGTNQAFNSVTRTCVSTSELRTRPVATKSSDTLSQEVAKTITLTYSDGNNNSAIACNVSSVSSNIEAISPQVINRGVFNAADLVFSSADSLALAVPVNGTTPAYRTAMLSALVSAKKTYNYSNVILQLDLFKTAVDNILTYSAPLAAGSATLKNYYDLTQARLLVYLPIKTFVDSRCDCTGGICTTAIAPRIFQNGTAGFTYTISDIDGLGDPKVVSLSIAALPGSTDFLLPAAESTYLTYPQSATNMPSTYTVTLPIARDYLSSTAFNYTITTAPAKGTISNCRTFGITRLCDYTPFSGDLYDTLVPAKANATIDDLVFTAKKEGSFANNYTVQYFDLQGNNLGIDSYVTKTESFGLISYPLNSSYNESFVRVVGNNIKVFINPGITTSADILSLLSNDQKAKSLVLVTGGSLATFPTPSISTPAAISLTGGSDAFDKFSYTASNGLGTSTNTATVMLKISHTDHAPLSPTQYNVAYMPFTLTGATTVAEAEGSVAGQIITLPYFDADNSPIIKAVTCAVDFSTPPNVGLAFAPLTSCACTALGVCTVSVVPTAFFNGIGKFSYTITTIDQLSAATQTSLPQAVNMTIWEVNNPPVLTLTSATATAAGVPTSYAAPLPNPLQTQENSSAAPSSAYICFTANQGGGLDEATQTLTVTPVQVAPTSNVNMIINFGVVLIPGATANACSIGQYMLPFSTTQNQSGTTNIKITLSDNGTTHGVANPQSVNQIIPLLVNSVDDPPYFIQTMSGVQTNEGGAVVAGPFIVDEDQGSSPDEDTQPMTITAITSDNPAVLPNSAITIFYDLNNNGVEDSGETRTVGQMLEVLATDDVKLHPFYLKLNPIAGVAGNANIKITINDGNVAPSHYVSSTFSLIVNPVAALHGGWANISAVGIKTDKNGTPASSNDVVCNYNKAADLNKCDTTSTDCTGATPPNSVVTPTAVNVLYWDSGSKRCYRSQGTDKFSWIEMRTPCPVTRVTGNVSSVCAGQNCLYDPTLLPAQSVPTATAVGQYYFNTSSNSCKYSTQPAPGIFAWSASSFVPSKVTLSWNPYTITGSGPDSSVQIEGWNVYRREAGYDYDFKNGFLKINSADTKTLNDSTIRTFTDITAIAGKVYYYLVRPIDNNHHFATYTPEIFSEVRVLAPVENYAFVHRWMVNQEVCNSMHMTTTTANKVDPTRNYRCPFKGPGESTVSPGYYDIEKDMLVDIAESGCPYAVAPKCTSNGCIGIGDPTSLGATGMVANDIYYDRNAGSCYIYNGAAWNSYNLASAALITSASSKTNSSLNAPLVNISQAQAGLVCSNRSVASATANLIGGISSPSLPSKKEYMAYSASPMGMSDSTQTDMEQGFSLNVQSRCNSSSANGLETAFTDSSIPSTSYIYSIAGTSSSGIRSLYTGSVPWGNSFSTETCSSRYGVQDIYGNVAQWVKDKMTCNGSPSTYVCMALVGTDLGNYDFLNGVYNGAATYRYGFNFLTGPYNDANADSVAGAGDAFLTNWVFRDQLFSAGKFSFPIGMPINIDIASASAGVLATSPTLPFFLSIGPTAGITSSQLHEDGIIVNGAAVSLDPSQQGSLAVGGSYLSGNLAGRFSSELIPSATVRPDVGFRCYIPILKTNFPTDPGRHTYSY
ncbi:MAG: hypothetical protein H7281_01840 [Bacteriovorax sp.]|nr:hypothetical protein [Bacteriovorax sp.]